VGNIVLLLVVLVPAYFVLFSRRYVYFGGSGVCLKCMFILFYSIIAITLQRK